MNARLQLDRIETHINPDPISDADWLLTEIDLTSGRIHHSWRYGDDDVARFGLAQVLEWIAEDHARHAAFTRGDWGFVCLEAVAVVGISVGDARVGTMQVAGPTLGGVESDAGEHIRELAADLVAELRIDLTDLGFVGTDDAPVHLAGAEEST